ncbi:MAG: ParA family protein, partial [Chloroflexi bacterium]|nr:ParA family protein [Chloroflexota bacterium]
MGRVLAVANMKGGVGKTTVTVNLGAALAERGQRLLLVDMDPQSNLSIGLGIDVVALSQSMYDVLMDPGLSLAAILSPCEGLTVAPAHLNMVAVEVELAARIGKEKVLRKKLAPLRERFDVVLIDCPPSLGLLTINALAAADAVLVPVQGQYYALYGVTQLMRTVHLVREVLNEELGLLGVVVSLLGRTKLE